MPRLPAELKKLNEALNVLHPRFADYKTLFNLCITHNSLAAAKLLHSHIIQSGNQTHNPVTTQLIIVYSKCHAFPDSRRIFHQTPSKDLVSWTAMIGQYASHGQTLEALNLYPCMKIDGFVPDQVVLSTIIPAAAFHVESLQAIHVDAIKTDSLTNVYVGSALVDAYAKLGFLEDARQVFDRMPVRNIVTWTAMLSGSVRSGLLDEAIRLFSLMGQKNVVSYTVMVSGFVQAGLVDKALGVFAQIPVKDILAWNSLLVSFSQNGYVQEALKVFYEMPVKDVMSWTAMVSGLAKHGLVDEAMELFKQMPVKDMVSWNAMISGYAQNGHIEEAMQLFLSMPERDVFSWTPLIAGHANSGDCHRALKLMQQMHFTGLRANSVTYASVLPACASMGFLHNGKQIHGELIRSGVLESDTDFCLGSALIDMYGKCASIDCSRKVFDKVLKQSPFVWNAMISAYAMNGNAHEAFFLFEEMPKHSMPDSVTFVAILSACCHGGYLHHGLQYFSLMTGHYGLDPTLEHYCCMVDLLGRAGFLEAAHDLICRMPIEPNFAIWRSLLAACVIHNDTKLGEHVAVKLLELNSDVSSDYVLLSNIYAVTKRWDERESIRKLMKERNVRMLPGCSWVEVSGHLHAFLAG